MTKEPQRARIRLELTERQKEQIWRATGREVNALELGLGGLTEPPVPGSAPAGSDQSPVNRPNAVARR